MTPVVSAEGKQHVEIFRKLLLRRHLLRWAVPGSAYVPFIGDGDIAAELYSDRLVLGADLDPGRVDIARRRLGGHVLVADCDSWPFAGVEHPPIAVADFDAYADPYSGFRATWEGDARFTDRLVLFFTDGRRQGMMRTGHWTKPNGEKTYVEKPDKAAIFNAYLSHHVWPWFEAYIAPWRVLDRFRYLRGMMVYWGAVIERG